MGGKGGPTRRMQYSRLVLLDFFERREGVDGLIRWPHISVYTLDNVRDDVLPVA